MNDPLYQETQGADPSGLEPVVPPVIRQPARRMGFSITAFVLGILSMLGFCCCIQFITAPIAVIFGILAFVKKRDGKEMAATGLVLAAVSLLVTIGFLISFRDVFRYADVISEDFTRLIEEQDEVFPAYQENGTLPDYLLKYTEPPYSTFLEEYDSSIYVIMDALLENYKNGELMLLPINSMPMLETVSASS